MATPDRARSRVVASVALAATLLVAASLHFVATDAEERLLPGWLPRRRELVYVSGVAEIAGALGLLAPRTRRPAALFVAALFVAVFPANVNHAVNNIRLGGVMDSRLYQWGRLPLQVPLVLWALWCAGWGGRR